MEDKIILKCKHCDNDDMKHIQIRQLVQANPDFKPYPYTAESYPYFVVGLHLDCAKCNKDTLIIIEDLHKNQTQLPQNVPQEIMVHVKFEKPLFSAIKYILTDEMKLDKVVVDINQRIISLITQEVVNVGYKEITEEQYKALKNKSIEEVRVHRVENQNNNGGKK